MMWIRAALILAFAAFAPSAFALRCDGRIVGSGDRDFQARERCGAPYWVDRFVDTEVVGTNQVRQFQKEVPFEIWYYNFGPRRLISRLVFRDGTLIAEDTLGYGVDEIGDDCNPNLPFSGMSAGELYAHCGEPLSRRAASGYVVRRPAPGVERWRDLRSEDWVYDFGEGRLLREIHLRDGRVESVESLSR